MTDDVTYRLRVQLRRTDPAVWRRVEVPGSLTLDRLHLVLHVAMGWTGLEGHEFSLGGTTRRPAHQPVLPADVVAAEVAHERRRLAAAGYDLERWEIAVADVPVEETTRVRDALPHERSVLLYLYGIAWEHRIRVERIEPGAPTRARVRAGRRSVPPQYLVNGWNWSHLMSVVKAVAEGRGADGWEADVAAHFPGLSPAEAWAAVQRFDVAGADAVLAAAHEAGRL